MSRRGRYQGVWNVVRFNPGMYVAAIGVVVLALLLPWPEPLSQIARAGTAATIYLVLASLWASHYIYDRSELYRWTWLSSRVRSADRVVNIHSGFDETSSALRCLYPQAQHTTLDFYDPVRNPEPSIARARRLYPPSPTSLLVDSRSLPLPDGHADLVCVLLAAHEIRQHTERAAFFREVRRLLDPEGRLILLEHQRDFPNWLVFGPGFLHFFPRSDWLRALAEAGLAVSEEFTVTPFLRGFVCDRMAP